MNIDDLERDLAKIIRGIANKLFKDPQVLSDALRRAIMHGGEPLDTEITREMLRRIIFSSHLAKCAFWDLLEPCARGRHLDRFPLKAVRRALATADDIDGVSA